MTNVVAAAELEVDPNFCTLDDLEAVFKGVLEVCAVDIYGNSVRTKETYLDESYLAYYYCNGCGQDWVVNFVQDQERAWKLAKQHLAE